MSDKPDFQIPLEPERYELSAPPAYRFEVDRSEFFRFLGAGILIVGVLKNAHALQESGAVRRTDESLPKEIGAWLHLGENGAVTVYTGKVEVGQNIRTSLSQCVAEELHVPVKRIQMVMGDTPVSYTHLPKARDSATKCLQRLADEPATSSRPPQPY